MSLLTKVGSFNTGTGAAGTTITVSDVGFQPKAIIFWWTGRADSADAIGRASSRRGFGVATSTTSRRAIANHTVDASSSSDCQRAYDDASCILTISAAAAIDGQVDLQSIDANGFTLVVDDQMPVDLRVHYLALGGDSLTNVADGQFQEPAATGNQDITTLSFQPDCIFFFSVGTGNAPPDTGAGSLMSVGAAVSSTARGTWGGASQSAQATMNTTSYCLSSECVTLFSTGAATTGRADFVSFLSNGFRLNWLERTSTRFVAFLALKGGNYTVGNLLTQTDTTTDIVESGFGFQPSGAIFFSANKAESTADTASDHDRTSIGAFSSLTDRRAQAALDEDAVADSEVTTAVEHDAVYANISAASAIDGLMDIKSVDSDGFTCIMDDADPSQAFVWYVAFGPAAGLSPPPFQKHTNYLWNRRM